MAINIGLAGIQTRTQDSRLILEWLKKHHAYKIKIFFNINEKHYVEVMNNDGESLNSILNPRFKNDIYGAELLA
jgi:hypothetical protein